MHLRHIFGFTHLHLHFLILSQIVFLCKNIFYLYFLFVLSIACFYVAINTQRCLLSLSLSLLHVSSYSYFCCAHLLIATPIPFHSYIISSTKWQWKVEKNFRLLLLLLFSIIFYYVPIIYSTFTITKNNPINILKQKKINR